MGIGFFSDRDPINYLDDIGYMESYVKNHFPRETFESDSKRKDVIYFRKADSRYWASHYALFKCSENPIADPIDILEKMENDFQIESIFAKQDINKTHYDNAAEAIAEIKNYLIKRRNT